MATTNSADIWAVWDDGHGGAHPHLMFRARRLLASQALARVPATTAGQRIHLAAAQVLNALRSVFVLDPVPQEMRQYVPRRDDVLRRTAENVSGVVASLLDDPTMAQRLSEATSRLNEQDVVDVTVSKSDLDHVMLMMVERFAGREHQVPAPVMSDGSLRFLAILVALLEAPTVDTAPEPLASEDAVGQTTLVIDALEKGLHASQAELLMSLVRDEVHRRRVRVLATAHSPALLDALTGDEHGSVVICERDRDGRSMLRRLVDLPNYVDIVAAGTLGQAAEHDRLRSTPVPTRFPSDVLGEMLAGPS